MRCKVDAARCAEGAEEGEEEELVRRRQRCASTSPVLASRPARPILLGEASARRTSFAWRDASATLASPTESSASPCGGDAAPKLRWRERARSGGHGSHCGSFEAPGRVEKEGSVTRRDRGRGQRAEAGYRGAWRPQEPRRRSCQGARPRCAPGVERRDDAVAELHGVAGAVPGGGSSAVPGMVPGKRGGVLGSGVWGAPALAAAPSRDASAAA